MTLAFWYWLILVIWILFGSFYGYRTAAGNLRVFWTGFGHNIILLILLIILGLSVFNDPLSTLVK